MTRLVLAVALFACLPVAPLANAQLSAPPNTANNFRDTSMIKPPAGAKVAIIEFEDLECPACAHAAPIVHSAIARYKVPLVRYDFPLKMHIWSFDAAVTARYIQDKISPQLADEFRASVFANQNSIASKDDLQRFTQRFFQSHGKAMPFVMDPAGLFTQEVKSDYTLGERVGLSQTPTIFVVTAKSWVQVTDVNYLYQTIDAAIAQTASAAPTTAHAAHSKK